MIPSSTSNLGTKAQIPSQSSQTMSAALPQLAIAKAAFSASLLRPDATSPSPCLRDDIEHFHSLLAAALTQCSPANVQVWTT